MVDTVDMLPDIDPSLGLYGRVDDSCADLRDVAPDDSCADDYTSTNNSLPLGRVRRHGSRPSGRTLPVATASACLAAAGR
jgi:hypothetical protein